jgi:Ca-activated chloride channel family protein
VVFRALRRLAPAVPLAGLVAVVGLFPASPAAAPTPQGGDLELVFSYGSEKKEWLEEVTKAFNARRVAGPDGRAVRVSLIPMGSGECVDALLDPEKWAKEAEDKLKPAARAHLTSPASSAFFQLANGECGPDAADARNKNLPLVDLKKKKNLVQSPVVIATWRPMAEALGWPQKRIGWAEVFDLATDPKGWAKVGKPQFGRFKFGHTHPELSNSGLIAVLAETYAGANKRGDLTPGDVASPQVRKFLTQIEQSVIFYGQSTGFFGTQMVKGGPGLLSAAVLYEDQVIKANENHRAGREPLELPMVAIYPKEGTFWSDHPAAVVDRPWVTDAHRAAADKYLAFLLDPDQQRVAMKYGFRPGEKLDLDAKKFSEENGVDAAEPKVELEVPEAAVMKKIKELWAEVKKPIRVVLVLDTSASMRVDGKMLAAKKGAKEFLARFGPRDELSVLAFDSKIAWAVEEPLNMDGNGHRRAGKAIDDLFVDGKTALYDAVEVAFNKVKAEQKDVRDRATAVVVLTDGEDTDSKLKLDALLKTIRFDPEGSATRIFTIAYGADANPGVLKRIAEATRALQFEGTPDNIRRVFKKIYEEQ